MMCVFYCNIGSSSSLRIRRSNAFQRLFIPTPPSPSSRCSYLSERIAESRDLCTNTVGVDIAYWLSSSHSRLLLKNSVELYRYVDRRTKTENTQSMTSLRCPQKREKRNLNSERNQLSKMEDGKYFFVEHVVTDKQGCDRWMGSWFDVFGKMIYW